MPEDAFMMIVHPRTLERLDAGDEALKRWVRYALAQMAKFTRWREEPSYTDEGRRLHREAFPDEYAGRG